MGSIVAMTGGGIKGAVAAARYAPDNEIIFLHIDYGQRSASAEAEALGSLAASLPASRVVALDMPHVNQLTERLERSSDPAGAGAGRDDAKMRNLSPLALSGLMPVLVATAVQSAIYAGASRVVMGLSRFVDASHLGFPLIDGQPDRRPAFVHAFNIMLETLLSKRSTVEIEVPLVDATYPEIVKLALHFRIPLENTWTCARSGRRPCGRCATCEARTAAFVQARAVDPLVAVVEA